MSNFAFCFTNLMDVEGGFTNNPLDHGGATNFGITQRAYEEYLGRDVTLDEMKNMTEEQAKPFYLDRYFNQYSLDKITDKRIAYLLFNQIVNRGPRTPTFDIQASLGDMGIRVDQDGKFGPGTIAAINGADPVKLGMYFCERAMGAYVRIFEFNTSQLQFARGWISRVMKLRRLFWL